MCLIFFSINQHPTYKLVIAANRDEFYKRQTAPADYWQDHPNIIGGRDLEAKKPDGSCGTWMAMTKSGKIGMVTNYRDPKNIDPNAPSRGHLVSDFLETKTDPSDYLKQISNNGKVYNGYNLVIGSPDSLWYLSNYQNEEKKLSNGLYGLSNHLLDTPWPKVVRGKAKFKSIIEFGKISAATLFDFMYDTEQAADDKLPETGIGLERERALSSMFIKTQGYGTRCSTVILIDRQDNVEFTERIYDLNTFQFAERDFQFKIEKTTD
jgi:uncharacterized protein with NRDE domain